MSGREKQEEQTKNICLLRKDGLTLNLVKEGDSFTDIKNGAVSILPEDFKTKPKDGNDISSDIEKYAHKLKRQEYGKKLNYQIENLLFLTGAGSSYLFGENGKKGKLMCDLWDDAVALLGGKQNMDAFCKKVRYTDKDEKNEYRKNLEKVLSLAEKAKDYITEPIFKTDKGEEWNIEYAISKIKKMIKENCNLQITSTKSSSVHEKFLNKITRRKSSIARVKLFTLNYDTLFEQAARKGNYTIIDGFSFSIPRIFSGRHFDYDIVIRDGSRIKNEDNFVPRVFHLYKPHGSVDWEKRGNNVYQNKAEEIPVENSLMIFPQENKYEHSYEQPFFEMMTRFQAALRMKNTTLVVIGFSFGDKHILSMINEALEQNPSFQLIIVNYRNTGIQESDIFYKEAGERGNMMMVNETFTEFVDAYPNIKIYDQSDEYRLVKIVNEGN